MIQATQQPTESCDVEGSESWLAEDNLSQEFKDGKYNDCSLVEFSPRMLAGWPRAVL